MSSHDDDAVLDDGTGAMTLHDAAILYQRGLLGRLEYKHLARLISMKRCSEVSLLELLPYARMLGQVASFTKPPTAINFGIDTTRSKSAAWVDNGADSDGDPQHFRSTTVALVDLLALCGMRAKNLVRLNDDQWHDWRALVAQRQ